MKINDARHHEAVHQFLENMLVDLRQHNLRLQEQPSDWLIKAKYDPDSPVIEFVRWVK